MQTAPLDHWQVEEMVALVRRRYSDWDGFDHPAFVADEIAMKRELVARMVALPLRSGSRLSTITHAGLTCQIVGRLPPSYVPQVGELLEPQFQAMKLLDGAATVGQLEEEVAVVLDLPPEQWVIREPGRTGLLSHPA